MSRTSAVRWILAGVVFVAISYYGSVAGHNRAFWLLVVALVFIAIFGGSRRH